MSEWHTGNDPAPATRATICRSHIRLGPGLIEENEPSRINRLAIAEPSSTALLDVRPIELGCGHRFFYG